MFSPPRPWWVLASLPLGMTTWIGLLYAGVRARMRSLQVLAGLFFATMVAGFALAGDRPESSTLEEVAENVIVVNWIAGIGVSIAFVPAWQRRLRSRRVEAETTLAERREAQELARQRPELARELGVGRPDVPRAEHHGLVDVNSAPASVLARLPGVDDALAVEILRVREELGGFSSLGDMGAVCDLPASTVEELRDRTVFVPRG
jgi:DNA uptake protein ComE-like DNA-binding protein